jgi:cobalt-zinc-cadmium resistance protein CzcA
VIERLVAGAERHRRLTLILTLAFAIVAVVFGSRVRFDALPDVTTNQVVVLTRAPGFTPDEVEMRVTKPIETSLGGLPGSMTQRSISRYGISSVTVIFDDDVDPYLARQLVKERLDVVEVPPGVEPPEIGPYTGGLGEIFHFTLSSPTRTTAELLELVELRVAPLLRATPGVVEINTWGGERRTLDVVADPIRMAQREVTMHELRAALERATGSAAAGSLEAGPAQALLRGIARPLDPVDLGAALVRPASGTEPPVRVADVATVVRGARTRIGEATANGRGRLVYAMVQMLRGANALDVVEGVKARMDAVRAVLPPDVRVEVVYDRSVLVRSTLHTVFKNLLEGGALVVVVLLVMLGSVRAGLLVALTIPLSMLGAAVGMAAMSIPGNLMSLGAIDFGLLVDGGVVMVESVFHRFGDQRPRGALERRFDRSVVRETLAGVARPVGWSVLVIVLVYLPIITLTGVDGRMFRPMALTVVFALLTSLVLSLTFVPAAASLFLRPRDMPRREPWLVRTLRRAYRPVLGGAMRHPFVVGALAAVMLAFGVLLLSRAGSDFVPQLDEGDLVIQTTRAPDIRIETAADEATRLEAVLLEEIPEVRRVVSRIGSPAVATDIMGLDMTDVFVELLPREEWREGLGRDALIREIDDVLSARAPGANPAFTQPIQMRFNELLGGSVSDVAVSIYGEDLGKLRRHAEDVAATIARQPGAVDVRISAPPQVALVEVHPRVLDAARYGLDTTDVLDIVQAVKTGVDVGVTYDGALSIPIRLRLEVEPSAFVFDATSLPTGAGATVRLADVAQVVTTEAPSMVEHEEGQRRIVVGFNVREGDIGSVVEGAREAVDREVERPQGHRLRWGGQYENLMDARGRLAVVIPIVLVLILGVLVWLFRAIGPALAIFLNVPFAGVGGMVALWLRDMPVSISAAIGFIALSGIAVLNGVVLMSRIRALLAEGMEPRVAVVDAALGRMRPVLMTALVAALGFVPMMLARGIGAEVQRPLATVVVGGLVTSTVLTLIVLPTIYAAASSALARRRARMATA